MVETLREMGVPPDVPLPAWLPPCVNVALVAVSSSEDRGGFHVWFFRSMEEATMGVPNESVLCLNTTVLELSGSWDLTRRPDSQEEMRERYEHIIEFNIEQTVSPDVVELACGTAPHERVIYLSGLRAWAAAQDSPFLLLMITRGGDKVSIYCEDPGWPPPIEYRPVPAFLEFTIGAGEGRASYSFTGWRADCGLDALIEIAESLRSAAGE